MQSTILDATGTTLLYKQNWLIVHYLKYSLLLLTIEKTNVFDRVSV